ncbi:hypothetical protein VP01_1776g2 [Puccinia sorghi]|uniref:Uncharacterized protein n=1 Tax=Puccinia sorghi TaxID=27349 RepID=A0A0L6VER3_9BASI|nr:hypothetical protein VP01_1776g2 [Puccinia sorghi]
MARFPGLPYTIYVYAEFLLQFLRGWCIAKQILMVTKRALMELQYTPQAVDVDSQVICMLKQDPHSASGGSDMEEGAITCMTSSPISTAPTRALASSIRRVTGRLFRGTMLSVADTVLTSLNPLMMVHHPNIKYCVGLGAWAGLSGSLSPRLHRITVVIRKPLIMAHHPNIKISGGGVGAVSKSHVKYLLLAGRDIGLTTRAMALFISKLIIKHCRGRQLSRTVASYLSIDNQASRNSSSLPQVKHSQHGSDTCTLIRRDSRGCDKGFIFAFPPTHLHSQTICEDGPTSSYEVKQWSMKLALYKEHVRRIEGNSHHLMLAEPKLSFYSITEGAEINKAKSGRDNSRALKDEQTISLMTRWMTKQNSLHGTQLNKCDACCDLCGSAGRRRLCRSPPDHSYRYYTAMLALIQLESKRKESLFISKLQSASMSLVNLLQPSESLPSLSTLVVSLTSALLFFRLHETGWKPLMARYQYKHERIRNHNADFTYEESVSKIFPLSVDKIHTYCLAAIIKIVIPSIFLDGLVQTSCSYPHESFQTVGRNYSEILYSEDIVMIATNRSKLYTIPCKRIFIYQELTARPRHGAVSEGSTAKMANSLLWPESAIPMVVGRHVGQIRAFEDVIHCRRALADVHRGASLLDGHHQASLLGEISRPFTGRFWSHASYLRGLAISEMKKVKVDDNVGGLANLTLHFLLPKDSYLNRSSTSGGWQREYCALRWPQSSTIFLISHIPSQLVIAFANRRCDLLLAYNPYKQWKLLSASLKSSVHPGTLAVVRLQATDFNASSELNENFVCLGHRYRQHEPSWSAPWTSNILEHCCYGHHEHRNGPPWPSKPHFFGLIWSLSLLSSSSVSQSHMLSSPQSSWPPTSWQATSTTPSRLSCPLASRICLFSEVSQNTSTDSKKSPLVEIFGLPPTSFSIFQTFSHSFYKSIRTIRAHQVNPNFIVAGPPRSFSTDIFDCVHLQQSVISLLGKFHTSTHPSLEKPLSLCLRSTQSYYSVESTIGNWLVSSSA